MPSAEFDNIVTVLAAGQGQPVEQVAERRQAYDLLGGMIPLAPDVTAEPVEVDGVRGEWVRGPDADASRAVLYLHGGGFVIGSCDSHRPLASRLATATKTPVLLLDYRLAPEHPHPAAIDDAVAAYRWLLDSGVKPDHLAIAGDSAGGGLTLATLVAARDAGLPMPAAAAVISPWVDLSNSSPSHESLAEADVILTTELLDHWVGLYLDGIEPANPVVSPIHADLSGLPPLLIQVGGREVLLDDAHLLADAARDAGGDVTLEVDDEMIHHWHVFAGLFPEGDVAVERLAAFVTAAWRSSEG